MTLHKQIFGITANQARKSLNFGYDKASEQTIKKMLKSGYSIKRIAAWLNITPNSVYKRISRYKLYNKENEGCG